MTKNLAIIPARGGSKRIPGKNIKNFLGKPIIAYSISNAHESGLFEEVMVSTEDPKIAAVAEKFGANVPFLRSEKNADDHATLANVLLEVINFYENKNIFFDNICCVLPTAPFLNAHRILEAYDILKRKNLKSVVAIVEYSYPIQRSLLKDKDSRIKMAWPKYLESRSQDLTKHYHDCGQFYWVTRKAFLEEKKLFTTDAGSIELKQLEIQDIDTLDDWKNAEIKYKILNAK